MDSQGLVARLSRTKTSGAGKARQVLPVFGDKAATAAGVPWLQTGWDPWAQEPSDRDYFLLLPADGPDGLEGTRKVEAAYVDAVAMTRVRRRTLQTADGSSRLHGVL